MRTDPRGPWESPRAIGFRVAQRVGGDESGKTHIPFLETEKKVLRARRGPTRAQRPKPGPFLIAPFRVFHGFSRVFRNTYRANILESDVPNGVPVTAVVFWVVQHHFRSFSDHAEIFAYLGPRFSKTAKNQKIEIAENERDRCPAAPFRTASTRTRRPARLDEV